MTKRTRDWDEGLAEDLRDPTFAREFLLAAVEESVSLQEAIGKVIRCYGIKEFADKIKMTSSNVSRAINPRHNPTQETLNKLLFPFGLVIGVKSIEEKDLSNVFSYSSSASSPAYRNNPRHHEHRPHHR